MLDLMLTLPPPTPPENSVPPDVTSSTPQERGSRVDLAPAVRGMSRGQSRSSMLDTADGITQMTVLELEKKLVTEWRCFLVCGSGF